MKSDEQWMREYRDGSEEGFNVLYEKYHAMVYAFVKKRMRDSELEDVYQKVWRKLHESRVHFTDQPFLPWLFVLMRNLIIDEYRSLGRRNAAEFKDELIEKLYGKEDVATDIEELLKKLPEDNRDLVRKYYLEGISYDELSKSTGLSQPNLRQRLSRALRGLRNQE